MKEKENERATIPELMKKAEEGNDIIMDNFEDEGK